MREPPIRFWLGTRTKLTRLIVAATLIGVAHLGCGESPTDEGPTDNHQDETDNAPPGPDPIPFVSVGAGLQHTCGIAVDGQTYCWGRGEMGQLGSGGSARSTRPTPIVGGHAFVSLVVGGQHACAKLSGDDRAYCWGWNGWGQLGSGTTSDAYAPVGMIEGFAFPQLAAGVIHACGIADDGAAYCWGYNLFKQLGNTSVTDSCTPFGEEPGDPCSIVPVPVEDAPPFAQISAGGFHTCGLTAEGTAYCWGSNENGQLGTNWAPGTCVGGAPCSPTPLQVDGGIEFSSIVAGDILACGLTADGAAYCWGYNNDGQLGNGETGILTNPTPALVSGGLSFASIHPARWHTCGLTTEGDAYCWGARRMLGNGSWDNTAVPIPTLVSGGRKWLSLSVNERHSCGITTDQFVYCWGANDEGQLGNGSLEDNAVPTPVSGPQ